MVGAGSRTRCAHDGRVGRQPDLLTTIPRARSIRPHRMSAYVVRRLLLFIPALVGIEVE